MAKKTNQDTVLDESSEQAEEQVSAAQLQDQISELVEQLAQTRAREQRALADYHNLVRRNQEERMRLVKSAAFSFIETLLQPLEHLSMAADQLNDPGLNMVVQQMWQALATNGLEEIPVMGKKFDVKTMEVVDTQGDGEIVIKIVRRGYTLNGEVIQHAKVVIGSN